MYILGIEEVITYLVVLVAPGMILPHSHDEVQNRSERPDGIWVTSQHDVAESDIVVGRNVASRYTCKGRLVIFSMRSE